MALIKCSECNKEISDRASACPGCGCPVPKPKDYNGYDKEELWQKAHNIQSRRGTENLTEAVEIYTHIIEKYRDSDEASYARTQLEILNTTGQKCKLLKFAYKGKTYTEETLRLTDIYEVSSIGESLENSQQYDDALMLYQYALSYYNDCPQKRTIQDRITKLLSQLPPIVPSVLDTTSPVSSIAKPSAIVTESTKPNSPEIPTGLYWATAILGFPLGTGIALGCYIGANSRINKGDYAKAQKYIDGTKIACWVIIVPCAIGALFLLSMCSLMFR